MSARDKGWWVDTADRNLLRDEDTVQTGIGNGDDLYELLVRSPGARADARRTLYGLPPERRAVVADLVDRAEREAGEFRVPTVQRVPPISLRPFPFDTPSTSRG